MLLLCLVQSWRPLGGGFDFWAHATVGRWIANHGRIPTRGLFLYSAPDFPWVYHSWLSQLGFYHVIARFGPIGVMVFNSLVVCLVFGLLWRLWNKRAEGKMPSIAPLMFLVAIYVSTARFQPRQELFTALLLVIFFGWLLDWHERRAWDERDARRIPLLNARALGIVLLIALWINLHALVLLPIVVLFVTVVCDAAQFRFDRRAQALLLVFLACCAATLCNPWGWKYWAAANVLKPGSQATYVEEWWPMIKLHRAWPPVSVMPGMHNALFAEGVLFLVAAWSWFRNPSRRWAELFWLLLVGAMFLRSRRMLWMLAIVCLVVMASNARSFDANAIWKRWRAFSRQAAQDEIPAGLRNIARAGVAILMVLSLVSFAQVFPQDKREFWPIRGVSRRAPAAAADYILKARAPNRVFTDYEYSSYFHWRFNGANRKGVVPNQGLRPLYADLLNAYPDRILTDYFSLLDVTPGGLYRLDQLGINTVVLGEPHFRVINDRSSARHQKPKDPMVDYLSKNPNWKTAFKDANAIVWIRRKPIKPTPEPK